MEGATIEFDNVVGPAHHAGKHIHDAALYANKLVFSSFTQSNQFEPVNFTLVKEFAKGQPMKGDKPTIYVCTGQECQLPTNDPKEVAGKFK